MLAPDTGGSERTPDDEFRRQAQELFAALGQQLLAASRALDSPAPQDAMTAFRKATVLLQRFTSS